MPVSRLLRTCLTVAIVMCGVAVDERIVVEQGLTLARRMGLNGSPVAVHPTIPPRRPVVAPLLEPSKIDTFYGATTSALGRDEPLAPGGLAPATSAEPQATRGPNESLRAAEELAPPPPIADAEPLPPPTDEAEPLPLVDDEQSPSKGSRLVSIGRETWVLAEPRWESRKLGYLRAGATVGRDETAASNRDCRGGWYRIQPQGYVCVGARATLDSNHPAAKLSATRPDRTGLPYLYALTRYPPPPLYARLPTAEEQEAVEGNLTDQRRQAAAIALKPDYVAPPEPVPFPDLIAHGELVPSVSGDTRGRDALLVGHAKNHSGWAFLSTHEANGRRFGLTTELALVPLDRTRIVRPSTFHGVALSDEAGLPIAVTRARAAKSYSRDAADTLVVLAPYAFRSTVQLSGREHRAREGLLLEARDGTWLRADQVTVIERYEELPRFAQKGAKWIDVSILRQSLVAYEGARPVYATLVSTGKDGVADHKDSHATIQGTFLIHTKHVSVTMDSDDGQDEFDLRDVPYVQYFTEGYALHAAYWHDDFGNPRSHGCVNLAPEDAAWLFDWTTPGVPEGWHAAMSLKAGTIVHIHP